MSNLALDGARYGWGFTKGVGQGLWDLGVGIKDLAVLFSVLVGLLALPTLIVGDFGASIDTVVIALVALWFPTRFVGKRSEED